jgi:hypothetical protein
MPAYDDTLNLEVRNRVLNHARGAEIFGRDDIGDVAMDKNVARLAVTDGGLGNPRVGTSQPEYFRTLAPAERWKEIGILESGAAGKGFVPGEDAVETVICEMAIRRQ